MCSDCQAARGHRTGPYPTMTRAQLRASLDLLPTWVLEHKATANRHVIVVKRKHDPVDSAMSPHLVDELAYDHRSSLSTAARPLMLVAAMPRSSRKLLNGMV
jgi:hypothetical protein